MSHSVTPNRTFSSFGNPFKLMKTKGSYLSPKLVELLNEFELALADKFHKLMPKCDKDVFTLSWAKTAMELLCQSHNDIKTLITALELPVSNRDDTWVEFYLDNSVKLLDICIVFSSEISRLNQGNLLLQCALNYLENSSSYVKACSSIDSWKHHIFSKNPEIDSSFDILDNFSKELNFLKIKGSAEGKVLMRAMYGVKVFTVFVCRIINTVFWGNANKLFVIQVPKFCLWEKSFSNLQAYVYSEMRSIVVLKELEAVDISVKNMEKAFGNEEVYADFKSDLREKADKLSEGLEQLAKQVDGFFRIVLSGRNALLCNLIEIRIP